MILSFFRNIGILPRLFLGLCHPGFVVLLVGSSLCAKTIIPADKPIEISELIRIVASKTKRNIIIPRGLTGKIDIYMSYAVDNEELYQLLLVALSSVGYTTVESGSVVKVMAVIAAKKDHAPIIPSDVPTPFSNKFVLKVMALSHVKALDIQKTLAKIGNSNSMFSLPASNSLIVAGTAFDVRRIEQVISFLDQAGGERSVRIFTLRHAMAKTTLEILRKSLAAPASQRANSAARVALSADERSNSILAFAAKEAMEVVVKYLAELDKPAAVKGGQAGWFYRPLQFSNAKKLATVLQAIRGRSANRLSAKQQGESELTFVADEVSNSLLIKSSREDYEDFDRLIRKLDRKKSQVFIEVGLYTLSADSGFRFGTGGFFGAKGAADTTIIGGWEASTVVPIMVASSGLAGGNGAKKQFADGMMESFSKELTVGVIGRDIEVSGVGKVSPPMLLKMIREESIANLSDRTAILSLDGEASSISMGNTLFFPITQGKNPMLHKENIDLSLELKPVVSSNNEITLEFSLKASSVTGTAPNGLPVLSKRLAKQKISATSGKTIVLAGFDSEVSYTSRKSIPLLSEIPLLGVFFRQLSKTQKRTQMVFTLTPHIIHGENDLITIYKKQIGQLNLRGKEVLTKISKR